MQDTFGAEVLQVELLQNIGKEDNVEYKALVSILTTALKREENLLITYSKEDNFDVSKITSLLDYLICSILPLSVSITNSQNKTHVPQNRRNKVLPRSAKRETQQNSGSGTLSSQEQKRVESQMSTNPSPFSTNIAIFESFHTYSDIKSVVSTCKQMNATFDGEQCELAVPFILIGIVPDNVYLTKENLSIFTFCCHLSEIPKAVPPVTTPFFQLYQSFLRPTEKPKIPFTERDVSTYISDLLTKLDTTPLTTSYFIVETKLMFQKAVEDYADLSGRKFIIPDDVQAIFPCLTNHKFVLPEGSTFAKNLEHINNVIESTSVPI